MRNMEEEYDKLLVRIGVRNAKMSNAGFAASGFGEMGLSIKRRLVTKYTEALKKEGWEVNRIEEIRGDLENAKVWIKVRYGGE
jgi:hypothetical protein